MSKLLTVFTPTYNRVNLLPRGYEALCRQGSHDFCWLIIDDGSKDKTRELVKSWLRVESLEFREDGFVGYSKDADWLHIEYVYKENGGLHTGYNKAIEKMNTEICVCIDSDDYMPDDGVEICVTEWAKYRDKNVSGLVGYDYTIQGQRLGNQMEDGKITHYVRLKQDKGFSADNKLVMRVDLLKQVAPQPSFEGERNFNPIWMILKVDQIAPFVLIDKTLCIVDYQENGMAANIINQFFNSPNSFMELRILYVNLKYTSLCWKIRHYIHLVANAKMAKKSLFIKDRGVNWAVIAVMYPIGTLLYYYLKSKRTN